MLGDHYKRILERMHNENPDALTRRRSEIASTDRLSPLFLVLTHIPSRRVVRTANGHNEKMESRQRQPRGVNDHSTYCTRSDDRRGPMNPKNHPLNFRVHLQRKDD